MNWQVTLRVSAPAAHALPHEIACVSSAASPVLPPGRAGTPACGLPSTLQCRSLAPAAAFDAAAGIRSVDARPQFPAAGFATRCRSVLSAGNGNSLGASAAAHRRAARSVLLLRARLAPPLALPMGSPFF